MDESNDIVATRPVTIRPPQRDNFPHPASNLWRRRRLLVCIAILLLLTSAIGVARLVAQAEWNIAQTEREIALAVDADSYRQDPAARKPYIQSVELQNDLALVHISADEGVLSQGGPTADEIIVYRLSAKGWERVESNEPDEPDRGIYRFQETGHLLFQYYSVDQGLVEAVAPSVETFTTDLARDIGLDRHLSYAKVTVKIAIVAATQRVDPFKLVGYVAWKSDGRVVLAQQLTRIPVTQAGADVLEQAIRADVAHRIILLAVEKHQPQAVWRPLLDGLQLWADAAHREFDFDLPNSPHSMNNLLHRQLTDKAPLQLPALAPVPSQMTLLEEDQDTSWQQLVLSKTVIDYAIAIYGRRSLAGLFDGMHQYDAWQGLIPAVFSVSMEEFESGWQAYLATHYNLYP